MKYKKEGCFIDLGNQLTNKVPSSPEDMLNLPFFFVRVDQ
jgi:hypothetical protein